MVPGRLLRRRLKMQVNQASTCSVRFTGQVELQRRREVTTEPGCELLLRISVPVRADSPQRSDLKDGILKVLPTFT